MDTSNGVWTTITTTLPLFLSSGSICCLKNSIYFSSTDSPHALLKLDILSMQWNIECQEEFSGYIAPLHFEPVWTEAPRNKVVEGGGLKPKKPSVICFDDRVLKRVKAIINPYLYR